MGSCSGPSVAGCPDLLSGAQIYSRVLARLLLTARRSVAALARQPPRYQALTAAPAPKPQRRGEMGCGTRERERGGGRRRLAALSSTDSSLGAGELGHTGLREEFRSAVMMQRPQDLDAACALAFLQEEALEGSRRKVPQRGNNTFMTRNAEIFTGLHGIIPRCGHGFCCPLPPPATQQPPGVPATTAPAAPVAQAAAIDALANAIQELQRQVAQIATALPGVWASTAGGYAPYASAGPGASPPYPQGLHGYGAMLSAPSTAAVIVHTSTASQGPIQPVLITQI
ncbi:hypothetical protein GUJ93_ZPchr0015g6612 [Zizania palustris]|uniref:Uncharacterized protein n=1 Tax=Zizania palustris TaxID=103762 RepID=A0A8J5THB2_ZIZPA|nr:hypothetical protein GUJ93_ZPchr0015g6612 [Zizania palustris]